MLARGIRMGAVAAAAAAGGAVATLARINAISSFPPEALARARGGAMPPLLQAHPRLADRIPWRPIGRFATPVEELDPPESCAQGLRLFVKRDDLSSELYGGNKVRKLEHLLAEAELGKRRTLVTIGGFGSNHALATALHGARLGFEIDLVLFDQPATPYARRTLRALAHGAARVHFAPDIPRAFATAAAVTARRRREGRCPYFIMVGGTTRLGCLGHVSAALELAGQIAAGEMPEPDRLFIPLGTCGTAVGLIVGLKLAGLRTRVTAVRVADPFPANAAVVLWMTRDLAGFLRRIDPSFPELRIDARDFDVVTDYLGPGYGFPTAPGETAVRWAEPRLQLETTYTGKALAACLHFARETPGPDVFLFWNSFNSATLPAADAVDRLPTRLRRIAEQEPTDSMRAPSADA